MLIEIDIRLLQRVVDMIRLDKKMLTEADNTRYLRTRNALYTDIQRELVIAGDQQARAYDDADAVLLQVSRKR